LDDVQRCRRGGSDAATDGAGAAWNWARCTGGSLDCVSKRIAAAVEAAMEILAGLLVLTSWIVGGFPSPDGAWGTTFYVGIVLAGIPAARRLGASLLVQVRGSRRSRRTKSAH
jgi:hypothetical protein